MPSSTARNAAIDLRLTELGWLAVAVGEGRMLAAVYGHTSPQKAERALRGGLADEVELAGPTDRDEALADDWAGRIEAYCRSGDDRLIGIVLDDDRLTPFAREVTRLCRQIPTGETVTYGELAAISGRPKAARAVGSVMARNPWPLVVPCHRVVGASGGLGGYSAPQGLTMKRRLLAMEGSLATA